MTDPSTLAAGEAADTQDQPSTYAPYGQLIKMLLPRCGGIAFYAANEDLLWCSDGYERPDLRALLANLPAADANELAGGGAIRSVSGHGAAFVYVLRGRAGAALGSLVVELAEGRGRQVGGSMVASLLRPVLDCLENQADLESTRIPVDDRAIDETQATQLRLLLEADNAGDARAGNLEHLVRECVTQLDCVLGTLLIPDRNLTVAFEAGGESAGLTPAAVSSMHKRLLAWLQLHDRAMVLNGSTADAATKKAPPYKILSCPLHDESGHVIGLLALFRNLDGGDFEPADSSILEFMGRKAVNLLNNRYDALTGLLNRYAFEHDARRARLQADDAAATAALLYVDIDRLNVINTAFGFHAGDEIIQRLAVIIRNSVAQEDIAGRLGGDRFAVLLPPSRAAADEALAETLRAEMSELTYLQGEQAMPVSVSIGIGRCAESNQSIGHAIAAAEYACKRAKELGRNRVEISHSDSAFSVAHRNDTIAFASLQAALKANRFSLDVQSIHSLQGEPGILGHETLMRMREGEGLVGPDKFLAAAQRYHLMPALDRWVIVETLRNLQSGANGLTEAGWISLNVSAQSFKSDSFREFLVEQLVASGVRLESLCIELRESSAAHNMRAAETLIHDLRELGVKVALDNFGSGLSSLAYLRRLPVHYIKIAGELVRRVATDRLAESMVAGIAQAATMLGIEAIAEHVETEAIATKLRQLDVRYGQGYYFSRPEPMTARAPHYDRQSSTAQHGAP